LKRGTKTTIHRSKKKGGPTGAAFRPYNKTGSKLRLNFRATVSPQQPRPSLKRNPEKLSDQSTAAGNPPARSPEKNSG
jgi:hypothetical protein